MHKYKAILQSLPVLLPSGQQKSSLLHIQPASSLLPRRLLRSDRAQSPHPACCVRSRCGFGLALTWFSGGGGPGHYAERARS